MSEIQVAYWQMGLVTVQPLSRAPKLMPAGARQKHNQGGEVGVER